MNRTPVQSEVQDAEEKAAQNAKLYPVQIPPMDRYNQALLDNIRPMTWKNPTPSGRYNLVVIGSGTAGLISAIGGSGLGAKVAMVEKKVIGGDCLNVGCVPSKSLIRVAKVLGEIRKAEAMGIQVPDGVQTDFGKVMERMRRIRSEISHDDAVQRLGREGVELYFGTARFAGPNTIEIVSETGSQRIEFAKAVIATGSSPRQLTVPGAKEIGYLTNETLFQLTKLPRRMAVIGGGPIGAEMAQAFARFGAEVIMIEKGNQILGREDADAAQIVQDSFRRDGIHFLFNTQVQSLRQSVTGKVIEYTQDGIDGQCEVDEVLVSIGRTLGTEELNLDAANIIVGDRGLVVDDTLRTTNPNVYAAGDVGFRYQFTHTADATARIVLQNALFPGPKRKASALIVPWTTYTDPEVAHVGLYPQEAEAKGMRIDTLIQPLEKVDRARTDGETDGFVKLHVKRGSDKIVGATIVAAHAGELISEITTAMVGGLGLKTFIGVIHPYPTQMEAIKKIADQYNRTRLTPTLKQILKTWFAWRR